jgi:hypothetical protein
MTEGIISPFDTCVPQMYATEVSAVALAKALKSSHVIPTKMKHPPLPAIAIFDIVLTAGLVVIAIAMVLERGVKNLAKWIDARVDRIKERNEFTQTNRPKP